MKIQDEVAAQEFNGLSDELLLSRFSALVKTERKITHQVLLHINEIERRKVHLRLGFDSLYSYLIRAHGYSGGSAQRRIQSAALLKDLPEIGKSIEEGRINLTQLNQMQNMMKQKEFCSQNKISTEFKKEMVSAIESLTTFETELFLSQALDLPVKVQEIARPQQDESLRLEITLSKRVHEKIQEAKLLLSHVKHDANWEETLELLADYVLSKKSPQRSVRAYNSKKQAETVQPKTASANPRAQEFSDAKEPLDALRNENMREVVSVHEMGDTTTNYITQSDTVAVRSRHIPELLRREVLRSVNGCEYVGTSGRCCGSSFQLQVDHILPLALGGTHTRENLRALCRAHNISEAERFGLFRPKASRAI